MQMSDRIERRMKLHDLHVLMAVAQTGSMRKAAAILHTTQSAISRPVADLEQTIGAKLLDRSTQGIEPTRYEHALLKRSNAVFDELKQGVQEIEFLSNPDAGELLIGSGSAFAEGFVLTVINRLSQQYPRVAYHVMPYALTALYDQLRQRRIELAFSGNSELEPQDDIEAEVLFEEPLAVAASANSPWVRRRRVNLAELSNEMWSWSPPAPSSIG